MNDRENRKREMFVRVQEFGQEHGDEFEPASVGGQLFTQLGTVITLLDGHAASQSSADGTARQGTTTRSQAREAVRDDLEAITRTARALADQIPGLDDKFRLPRSDNDQNLLHAARGFLADAQPHAAQFIAHELPDDFLADLTADIAALEESMQTQSSGLGHRVAAGAAIDETIDTGISTVRKLDAIVKNKYRSSAATLAQWTSASHTERGPRRSQSVTSPPGTQPPTPGGTTPPA